MSSLTDKIKESFGKLGGISVKDKLTDFNARQKIMVIFIGIAVMALLFYWTNDMIQTAKSETALSNQILKNRIGEVQQLSAQLADKEKNSKQLSSGLLSHIQNIGIQNRIGGAITNIRLISSAGKQEQVSFRSENLVYQEFTTLLKDLEQYDNIWVKTLTLTKRFDNPGRIDVVWDVVRSWQ